MLPTKEFENDFLRKFPTVIGLGKGLKCPN